MLTLKWVKKLSMRPMNAPPGTIAEDYVVNSAAISDDASRVVASTYYQKFPGMQGDGVNGKFGTYCFDTAGTGKKLFQHEFTGDNGVYTVAISGDGQIAASGGASVAEQAKPFQAAKGFVRAFKVPAGTVLLDVDVVHRVNAVALSGDGSVLVAVAGPNDRNVVSPLPPASMPALYVFLRDSSGTFSTPPQVVTLSKNADAVALDSAGKWVATCDHSGTVYLCTIAGGVVNPPVKWTVHEPGLTFPVAFCFIAAARGSDSLVLAVSDFIYLLTVTSLSGTTPGPVATFSTRVGSVHHSVRMAAIADDASFIVAVVNDGTVLSGLTGRLIKLSPSGATLTKDWEKPLSYGPNSVGIDSSGTRIVVSDGYPTRLTDAAGTATEVVPGTFYLFDEHGVDQGAHPTAMMNWPVAISGDGTGVIGGTEDNALFFFTT